MPSAKRKRKEYWGWNWDTRKWDYVQTKTIVPEPPMLSLLVLGTMAMLCGRRKAGNGFKFFP